ncbi:PaaI family thioesterase [Halopseudomonas phragmitis]|uniref:Thioesterase n=2 Tax=Pseudomonadaceae TaxID=135621 RepID=A0A1V0B859_9GAMM|nr:MULTISPECIES: PaaI family thioesterase [Pseudomonadaceae]AQZ96116.1 thioesterase [Halopseudomonas phragmitis]PAU89061.1 thioesterase [Pseudomonas sp. WN033]RHW20953.1 PaaI family thioesterase [Pseudomonas jilinensis]
MSLDAARIETLVREAHTSGDYAPLVEVIPYARMIGLQVKRLGEEVVFQLPSSKDNIGNPVLPALHGGVIAGFMEQAAMLHLMIFMNSPTFPKIIDFSIDYLRAGLYRDTYATCQVWRQGRRVGNVAITAWQTRSNEPIATARAHFKLD